MQSIVFLYTKSTNISFNNYLSLTNIIWSCGYQYLQLFLITTTFRDHVRQRPFSLWTRHFIFLLLRTREGYMSTITKSRLITAGTFSIKQAWARLPPIEIEQDSAIIDLAYLFAGLVTITQFCLVHCILQGAEHTDPMEWSNSHLLHWRQIHTGCSTNSQFFNGCS